MITMRIFDRFAGRDVFEYTMTNRSGASVSIIEYGATVTSIKAPDKNGVTGELVCGFDDCEGYKNGGGYPGAAIGRYANRIAGGSFTLNGKSYRLACNEGGVTHLHGGNEGFNAKMWAVTPLPGCTSDSLELEYTSPDGEEGYPGTLKVRITYSFNDENELSIRYEAESDADTPVNLTNHSYFNLSGRAGADILSHELMLDCDRYSAIDDKFIPAGAPLPVKGTPFDFTSPKPVGRDIDAENEQLRLAGGYDHNFIFRPDRPKDSPAAILFCPESGRELRLYTGLPAVQLYSANMLNGSYPMRGGEPQTPRRALCLETQFYPDSPNRPDFPDCILRAGEKFDYTTVFAFGVRE